jgi:LacI family transcriptional regulator
MGFDNQEFSKFTNPKLSTVNLPVEKMAYCAGELLVKTISDPYGDVDQQIFDLEIIHRNTTRIK